MSLQDRLSEVSILGCRRDSEKELRELRKKVTFAIFAEEDDPNKVTALVDSIFTVLQKTSVS
jgi:type I restriction enzyme R subunit